MPGGQTVASLFVAYSGTVCSSRLGASLGETNGHNMSYKLSAHLPVGALCVRKMGEVQAATGAQRVTLPSEP